MKAILLTVVVALGLLLGACAHKAPVTAERFCDFKRHSLSVPDPSLAQLLISADVKATLDAQPGPMLFLSGGSQHGAFGAGFLKGWAERRGGELPQFAVVTGISTGAILGTFAFIDDPSRAAEAYRLLREDQILDVYASGVAKKNIGIKGGLTAARKGAIADLVPFRRLLRSHLPDQVLAEVAKEGRDPNGRRFYVGAVNLDSGQAEIFDMTHMAAKAMDAEGPQREFYRDCYVEAIAASSSVPLAAKPVFIDNRMYIDGGARYALFSHQLGPVLPSEFVERPVYMILNGDGKISSRCGKRNESDCLSEEEPKGKAGAHADWSLTSLAFRTVDVLQNQVARLSMAQAEWDAEEVGGVKFERIRDDKDGFQFTMDDPRLGTDKKSCAQWREEDERIDRPFEFHPRYMRCLVAYGAYRAGEAGW